MPGAQTDGTGSQASVLPATTLPTDLAAVPLTIELHYLPCLAYFAALLPRAEVRLEAHETYQKQSYRNRCYVQGPHGVTRLTVPVRESRRGLPVRQVRIDDYPRWPRDHWRTLEAAYRKAPFFDHYAGGFEKILGTPIDWTTGAPMGSPIDALEGSPPGQSFLFLFDLNLALLTLCLQLLGAPPRLTRTLTYQPAGETAGHDLRDVIHPKKPAFVAETYHPVAYQQNFGRTFAPNLSILDLLFCAGPAARHILRQSTPQSSLPYHAKGNPNAS